MKTLIIIPSRLSATRLPGKPLFKINGLSIISHVVKNAENANIGEVYVATEDQEIVDDIHNNYKIKVYSCPGSASCSSSSINTHKLADRLSHLRYNKIHISGCKKGCALSKAADLTLVGNNGLIDVIFNGKASDKPDISSLTDIQLLKNL